MNEIKVNVFVYCDNFICVVRIRTAFTESLCIGTQFWTSNHRKPVWWIVQGYLNAGTSFIWSGTPFLVGKYSWGYPYFSYSCRATKCVALSYKNLWLLLLFTCCQMIVTFWIQKLLLYLSLFNVLRFPLSILPVVLTKLIEVN